MTRIAHLIASAYTRHGPTEGILAHLASRRGAPGSAEVWSMYPPPPGRSAEAAFGALGVPLRVLAPPMMLPDPRILSPILREVRRFRPNILQGHLVRANLWGRAAGRITGVPVVCTVRGVEDYFLDGGLAARLVRAVERHSARAVARYVAVSDGVRDAAIAHVRIPAELVVTIRNAVDLSPFREQEPRDRVRARFDLTGDAVIIGTVASLEPRKNIDQLIAAFARARTASPVSLALVIVGDGPERAALAQRARALGLESAVRFLGFRADAAHLVAAFDVFALTSRGEGLPRAVMEAMAAGTPCVVTDVGGNREAVTHGIDGFIHALDDVDGFAGSLVSLALDRSLRERMGTAARTTAFARFSPDRLAAEYEALYEWVLARRAS